MSRSSTAAVRNPLLALPAARALLELLEAHPEVAAAIRRLLLDLAADSRARADKSWRTHKGPMALYWKCVAVYAGHTARLLKRKG